MSKKKKTTTKDKEITLSLSVFQRMHLCGMLPQRSSYHKGLLIRQIERTLELTDEELKEHGVRFTNNGAVLFKNGKESSCEDINDYTFPTEKFTIIKEALKRADDAEELLVSEEQVMTMFEQVTGK